MELSVKSGDDENHQNNLKDQFYEIILAHCYKENLSNGPIRYEGTMMKNEWKTYCSWCYQDATQFINERNVLSRNIYMCGKCQGLTVECRACKNMARATLRPEELAKMDASLQRIFSSWNDEFCAEHDGTISSFRNLSITLKEISDYDQLFNGDSINFVKAGKIASITATGIIAVGAFFASSGTAAPIAASLGKLGLLGAASTGTAISTLSGAALTSASLAAIGGSVATGITVITAAGAALGGIKGAVIANRYHSDDPSFAIRKLSQASAVKRNTVIINGFLCQDDITFSEWTEVERSTNPSQNLYGVNWSSSSRSELTSIFGKGSASTAAKRLIDEIKKGGRNAASTKGLGPVTLVEVLSSLMSNPWHVSMVRAAQAGVQLAEAIARTDGQEFRLVGHSLGCRVIYYTLQALATKTNNRKFISDVILMGGAIGKDDEDGWSRAASAISGKIFNCFSKRDSILTVLYQTANAGLSTPIGIGPIDCTSKAIINIECTSEIDGHSDWSKKYGTVLQKVSVAT